VVLLIMVIARSKSRLETEAETEGPPTTSARKAKDLYITWNRRKNGKKRYHLHRKRRQGSRFEQARECRALEAVDDGFRSDYKFYPRWLHFTN
jgi:hypothetical protein